MAPRSVASPKMTTPAPPMTLLFYCRILFYSKNVDVCKKLELNPLRFDRDIKILSSIITHLFYMRFNIDTRGPKKAPKSQNIAVGIYQDPKPWVTKG